MFPLPKSSLPPSLPPSPLTPSQPHQVHRHTSAPWQRGPGLQHCGRVQLCPGQLSHLHPEHCVEECNSPRWTVEIRRRDSGDQPHSRVNHVSERGRAADQGPVWECDPGGHPAWTTDTGVTSVLMRLGAYVACVCHLLSRERFWHIFLYLFIIFGNFI